MKAKLLATAIALCTASAAMAGISGMNINLQEHSDKDSSYTL